MKLKGYLSKLTECSPLTSLHRVAIPSTVTVKPSDGCAVSGAWMIQRQCRFLLEVADTGNCTPNDPSACSNTNLPWQAR